jgi:hypothetical protein
MISMLSKEKNEDDVLDANFSSGNNKSNKSDKGLNLNESSGAPTLYLHLRVFSRYLRIKHPFTEIFVRHASMLCYKFHAKLVSK